MLNGGASASGYIGMLCICSQALVPFPSAKHCRAATAAWRQVKALFIRAREVYEAYQAVNTPSDEATNNSETHNDSEYT